MPITTLTNELFKKRLQIANACAAKKGYDAIVKENKGIPCNSDKKKVQRSLDLIDAIISRVDWIETVQAFAVYDANHWTGGAATFNLTITMNVIIGGSNQRTVAGQSSINGALTAMAASFNGLGLGTIATYDPVAKLFILTNPTDIGAAGNGKVISGWTASGGGAPGNMTDGATFAGGITGNEDDEVDETDQCLTNVELISILDELCRLCNEPCETLLNFES